MKIFKKEREVTELAMRFLGIARDCVGAARHCVDLYLDGNIEAAGVERLKVCDLESKADKARREIGDKLFSGAYLPLIRGDIYGLIESLDRVPDAAESCCQFFLGQHPQIPEPYVDAFREVAHCSFDILNPLVDVVKAFFNPKVKIKGLRESAKAVSTHETDVDTLEWKLITRLFADETVDLAVKMHAKRAISRVVEISDRAEDCSDQIELVGVKSVG